ncbi:MAG: hypothetical protein AB8C84_00035 [Oligoflexales bacterium]
MKFFIFICFYLSALTSSLGYSNEEFSTEYIEQPPLAESRNCCSCIWPGDSYVITQQEVDLSLKFRIVKQYPRQMLPVVGGLSSLIGLILVLYVRTAKVCENNYLQITPPCFENVNDQECIEGVIERCGGTFAMKESKAIAAGIYTFCIAGGIVFAPVLWSFMKHSAVQCLNHPSLRSHANHFLDMTSHHISERYQVAFDAQDLEEALQ